MAEQSSGGGGFPLWILGAVGLVAIGGIAVWSGQKPRDLHDIPEPTEATSPKVPGVGAVEEPDWLREQREAAERALEANPDDLLALNTLTQFYVGDPPMAMKYNKRALEVAPDDPDARVLKAVLASELAMHDKALEQIDAVLAEHPDHPRALYFRGTTLVAASRAEEAIPALEEAIEKLGPDPGLKVALEAAKRQLAGPGELVVKGTLEMASEVPGAAVFVSVKNPEGGPPLAAVQLPNGPFPMPFEVRTSDLLAMGGVEPELPEAFVLSARLDQDGNATTKVDGEPAAEQSGVAVGTEGLTLTLQ